MAIDCLDECIRAFGTGIYVYHEIVHNRYVVDRFTALGVTFVENLDEVPRGSLLLYSAHGVSPAVREHARQRDLRTLTTWLLSEGGCATSIELDEFKTAEEWSEYWSG